MIPILFCLITSRLILSYCSLARFSIGMIISQSSMNLSQGKVSNPVGNFFRTQSQHIPTYNSLNRYSRTSNPRTTSTNPIVLNNKGANVFCYSCHSLTLIELDHYFSDPIKCFNHNASYSNPSKLLLRPIMTDIWVPLDKRGKNLYYMRITRLTG